MGVYPHACMRTRPNTCRHWHKCRHLCLYTCLHAGLCTCTYVCMHERGSSKRAREKARALMHKRGVLAARQSHSERDAPVGAPAHKSSPVKPERLHRPVSAKKGQLCEGRNEGGAVPRCTVPAASCRMGGTQGRIPTSALLMSQFGFLVLYYPPG